MGQHSLRRDEKIERAKEAEVEGGVQRELWLLKKREASLGLCASLAVILRDFTLNLQLRSQRMSP